MRTGGSIALVWSFTFVLLSQLAGAEGFEWQEASDDHIELTYNGKPALRYVMPTLDESSPERRNETFKPFHHVWSPDGETLLTKGPGGLYPHHRGLFYGFNKITYGDGKKCDTWHCTGKAFQEAVGEAWTKGERDGSGTSHCLIINWHGEDGEVFAQEHRVVDISRETHHGVDGWEIDFVSLLETKDGKPIHLDGDPQHAGFHFRATQEVPDKSAKQTYYLRTDGKGQEGGTINWEPDKPDSADSKKAVNRPWNAMSIVVEGKRFTVLYIDHPDNPKPARYSERDYGRFGSYFVADVTEDDPLQVHYRLWIQEGEMTPEQCAEIASAYVPDLEQEIRDDPFEFE